MFQANNGQSSADRFIPRRSGQSFDVSKYILSSTPTTIKSFHSSMENSNSSRYVNYGYEFYKRKTYEDVLWTALVDKPKKVLNFSEKKLQEHNNETTPTTIWPVKPRKMAQIQSPLTILDVPGLKNNICHHVLDWGNCGYLASIYDKEVFIWNPNTNSPYLLTDTMNKVEYCIKWNRTGNKFAMSMVGQKIAIWDMTYNKITYKGRCICFKCIIISIEWTQDDKFVLSGCSNGTLCIWTSSLKLTRNVNNAHENGFVNIVMSPNNTAFITSGLDNVARVWNWPIRGYFEISLYTTARAIAFHPWRQSLIAIGDSKGCLTVYNICAAKDVGHKFIENTSCDALAWNKITGELVVSYWSENSEFTTNEGNLIVVYSDLNTNTDQIKWHFGHVPYLLWGNEGTQIASAGTDENLCIWNFVNPSKSKSGRNNSVLKKFFNPIR